MTCRAVMLACLLPALSFGQAQLRNPFGGQYDYDNAALSGSVERLAVAVGPTAWTNYMTAGLYASVFKQSSKLRAAKAMLGAAVDAGPWVRPSAGYSPTGAVYLTRANLLSTVGAPPDWWTNTPTVDLAGNSNGWPYLAAIMSNIVWATTTNWVHTNDMLFLSAGLSNTAQGAVDQATAVWPFFVGADTRAPGVSIRLILGAAYEAWFQRNQSDVISGEWGLLTNRDAACDLYAVTIASTFWADVDPTNEYWAAQGDAVTTNYSIYTSFTRGVGDPDSGLRPFVDPNVTNAPTEFVTPTAAVTHTSAGWLLSDIVTLHRFNAPGLTNGFAWFR